MSAHHPEHDEQGCCKEPGAIRNSSRFHGGLHGRTGGKRPGASMTRTALLMKVKKSQNGCVTGSSLAATAANDRFDLRLRQFDVVMADLSRTGLTELLGLEKRAAFGHAMALFR